MTDRVLFIEPDGLLAQRSAGQLSAGLAAAGCECLRCDARLVGTRSPHECDVSIDRARPWDLSAIRRLRQLIGDWKPDVIYVLSGDAHLTTLAAASQHAGAIVLQRDTGLTRWERFLRGRDVHFLATSQAVRQRLAADGQSLATAFVPSLGDSVLESKRLCQAAQERACQALALPAASKLFGIAAELTDRERLRDVIWAADLLKVVRPDTHVLIFGEGSERVRLERFRRRVEIEDRVHFIGDVSDRTDWLPALAGYWCTAGDDSIPWGMLEAQRLGVPLIVSDTAGHRELVPQEQQGLLFAPGNRAHLARQSLRVLEEPGLAERLSDAGKTWWRRELAPTKMVERFLAAHFKMRQRAIQAA
jgi:hypothetical protein